MNIRGRARLYVRPVSWGHKLGLSLGLGLGLGFSLNNPGDSPWVREQMRKCHIYISIQLLADAILQGDPNPERDFVEVAFSARPNAASAV